MTNWAGPFPRKPPVEAQPVRVAQYVRMSTEMQVYSAANQRLAVGSYCEARGWEIVRTYADEGRSGLTLEGREGLGQLLRDVISGQHDFEKLIVYDVSRWGRFQDVDESAHYEFLLRQAGLAVVYCAEPFENDGSAIAAIFKSVKRAMAGEYSRELSAKVFEGRRRATERGFWSGGPPGFGFRRVLQSAEGVPKLILKEGERKSLQQERVILRPGPPKERAIVRRIFHEYVKLGRCGADIARSLEAESAPRPGLRPWSYRQVYEILTNAKYTGDVVYNRRSNKLRQGVKYNPQSDWIIGKDAIPAIVPRAIFDEAQGRIGNQTRWQSDEQLLAALRDLWERVGTLSAKAVTSDERTASLNAYRCRFGSLTQAYALIGHPVDEQYLHVKIQRSLRPLRERLIRELYAGLKAGGAPVRRGKSDTLKVDGHTISIMVARHSPKTGANTFWRVRYKKPFRPTIGLVARMAPGNENILDYYALPDSEVDVCAVHWLTPRPPEFERFRGENATELTLEILGRRERELI